MTEHVDAREVEARLSDLLQRVERGEEVVVTRAGKPVARLTAVGLERERPSGSVPFEVPQTFFDDLPDEELRAWE
ncbi:type II toxin-antitoxin system Phd/YefM family antitoxin [Luteimicrobium sp. DT211]|uniref:type II toxin-antitoxin system Phd/YefM family antitoxin n=1 Tax=Luteimicrobium sp. DT211 TaxID=3393412 RepID=UPI003CE919FB